MVRRKLPADTGGTKDLIIQAGIREFGELGFHGARIDSIAKRSGLNKAMIYYHFKNKKELYEAILERQFTIIYDKIIPALTSRIEPDKRITELVHLLGSAISDIDDETKKMLLREVASGGKFFASFIAPKFIKKILPHVRETYKSGKKSGIFRDEINPIYTQMTMVGSLIFANCIFMVAKDSPVFKLVFGKSFQKNFISNLVSVLSYGVMKK